MNKKLVIIIVSVFAFVALAVGGIGFYIGYNSSSLGGETDGGDRSREEATTLHSDNNVIPSGGNNSQGSTQTGTQNGTQGGTQSGDLASQLLGKWRDGAGMSGFEFKADGRAVLTYIDLGFTGLNIFKGDVDGVYTLDGDRLTVSTSIYVGTISKSFTASVSGNVLTLVSTDDGSTSTYMRSEDTDTDVGADSSEPQPEAEGNGLIGVWSDGAGMSGYEFKEDGTLSFTYINLEGFGYEGFNGSYPGSYSVNGNEIKISYSIYSATISNTYTYSVNGNVLTLTADDGNVSTYMKK